MRMQMVAGSPIANHPYELGHQPIGLAQPAGFLEQKDYAEMFDLVERSEEHTSELQSH